MFAKRKRSSNKTIEEGLIVSKWRRFKVFNDYKQRKYYGGLLIINYLFCQTTLYKMHRKGKLELEEVHINPTIA